MLRAGPYVFKEWRARDRAILEINPDYCGGAPAIKRLVHTWAPSDNARAALLTHGTVDAGRFEAALVDQLKTDPRDQVVESPADSADVVVLPNGNALLGAVAVRRALGLGVNRQVMASSIVARAAEAASGLMRPDHGAFDRDVDSRFVPNAAAAALEQAGRRDADLGRTLSATVTCGMRTHVLHCSPWPGLNTWRRAASRR